MEKYNIIDNRPELSLEQVENGRNFNKAKQKALTQKKLTLNKNLYYGLGSVLVIVVAAFLLTRNSAPLIVADKPVGKMESIGLYSDSNQLTSYIVNSTEETILNYKTGSIIKIPKDAFVDSTGAPVSGEVEIKYREFHNVGEIILADISMTYDSANEQKHFESAGMFEIYAFKDGKRIFIKEDKPIEVNLISLNDNKEKFNKYYLDDKTNKWQYVSKDVPTIVEQKKQLAAAAAKDKEKFDLVKPIEKNKKRQQLKINVDYAEFPELKVFNNILFEVSPKNKNYDVNTSKIAWEDILLEKIEGTSDYLIKLANRKTSCEIIAYPVLESKDFSLAKANWDVAYDKYNSDLKLRKKAEKDLARKLKAEIAESEARIREFQELQRQNQRIIQFQNRNEDLVYRTFQVRNFGIWNSDCPQTMPQEAIVNATYKTEDGKTVGIVKVFLVESGKNALYTLYSGEKVYFNPKTDNSLIVITSDNSLAYYSKDDFKSVPNKAKQHTFVLKVIKKEKYSASDIVSLI
ncbi:MAG: hypothetical protein WCK02_14525 [Bacteroidota bacterium]